MRICVNIIKNIVFLMILLNSKLISQDFVRIEGSRFFHGLAPFSFLGMNAYYLQSEAARGNRFIVDDVMRIASENNFSVIRTWAFNDSSDEHLQGVIQTAPSLYSEEGLEALDYVVAQAKRNNIRLILTLTNNYKDFGGIPQYIRWAEQYLNLKLSHSDFFTNDSLKNWFRRYMHTILCRTNKYTGLQYRNEPAIFSFELINEAENAGMPYRILLGWYNQMSSYFKQIDKNHLLSTGEAGYDCFREQYSGADLFYNGSNFLFNGYKGTSYFYNTRLDNIDYASYHLYPDGYGFSPAAGSTWIKEHEGLAYSASKPALLSEFGVRNNKAEVYEHWLNSIVRNGYGSAIIWQYRHPDLSYDDGYGFNETDKELFGILTSFVSRIADTVRSASTMSDDYQLFQNYPNPFNPVTRIKYSIPEDCYVTVELFNAIGERVGAIEDGMKPKGTYELTLSFEDKRLGSGVYIYTLKAGTKFMSRKMLLLK